jgi:hypothetical protein
MSENREQAEREFSFKQFGFQKGGSTDNSYSAITGWSLDL